MNVLKSVVLLAVLNFFLSSFVFSQKKTAGYSFEKYPVSQMYEGKKAVVNLKSSAVARNFRTEIKNQYKNAKIDFAGKYSMIFWGAGTGLTMGAMVDNSTGSVYELPLTEENSARACWGSEVNTEDNILHNKKSTLFITWTCEIIKNETTNENFITKAYSIFQWDETKKKFKLLKTKAEKTKEKITSE